MIWATKYEITTEGIEVCVTSDLMMGFETVFETETPKESISATKFKDKKIRSLLNSLVETQ